MTSLKALLLATCAFALVGVTLAPADAQSRRTAQERYDQDMGDYRRDRADEQAERRRDGPGPRTREYQRREDDDCARLREDARRLGRRAPC